MSYLLDSNPCVHCLRPRGNAPVRSRLASHPAADIYLRSVVLGELHYGAQRSRNPRHEHAIIDAFAAQFVILTYDTAAARIYSEIRRDLEIRGLPIGPYDFQIAAIALANNLILITHNTKEFSRVPGLALDDWELP